MAPKINPSKLLPQSKSSSIVKTEKPSLKIVEKKVNIASSLRIRDEKSFALSKDVVKPKKINDVEDVNSKLLKIDKFFKTEFSGVQKKAEEKRKEKEKKEFEEGEKRLELPKLKGFSLPKLPLLPTFGIFDRIKRFLFFTAVGWLLPKIIEFIPKLERFAQMIVGVYKFAEGLFGKLFDGFFTLLKFGGDLKDKTIGFIAQITAGNGGNFQKEFDKLEKQFNNFANLSIITGLLAADIGLAALDEFNKQRKKQPSGKPPKPGEPRKPAPKVTTGQGGKPGLGKGTRVTTSKKPSLWQRLTGGVKSKFAGVGGKLTKPFSKFAGAAIPGLGAAIGFADARAREKSGDKLGAFLANLSAGLDVFTASVGAAGLIAAATGVGLPGAAALGAVAGVAGTLSMAIDVVVLVRDIMKAVGLPAFSGGGRVLRKYQNGGTTRDSQPVLSPIKRTLKNTRIKKPLKIPPTKSQPGKDVGGKKSITRLFPDTDPRSFSNSQDWARATDAAGDPLAGTFAENQEMVRRNAGKKVNPYKALTSTAKILKDIPLVGGIMGAAVDISLGQKPNKKVYEIISSGIGYLVDSITNQKINTSISTLMRDIKGFAEGGSVSSSGEINKTYNSMSSGDLISKVLGPTIDQRVNEAVQNVQKELKKKTEAELMKEERERMERERRENALDEIEIQPGTMRVTSDSPDFWLLVTAALFENGKPNDGYQGAADVAQAIYNRVSLPGWPKTIRKVILEPSQFQPVRQYGGTKEWEKINSRESAIAFAKKYKGYTGDIVDRVAATLLDESKQTKARDFVGPRDSFRNAELERTTFKHLDDSTEVTRYEHVFGFEPGGANIGKFKKGELKAAQINQQIVRGSVEQLSLSPGRIPKADYVKGVLDESGESGFDVTWKGDNNIAVLSGRVKEIGQLYGSGYGNVVVIESIDPVTGKKVDVMYAHFPTGGISVREGQQVSTGQVLGRMGKPGERGIGNITGQHASIDFYQPNSRRGQITGPYSRWRELSREIISAAQTGNNPSNWPRPQSQPPQSTPSIQSRAGQQPPGQQPGRMTPEQVRQSISRVNNLKPGDPPVVFSGIGSIEVKRGGPLGFMGFGEPERVYRNSKGQIITKQQFNDLMIKYRLPLSTEGSMSRLSGPKVSIYSGHADMLRDSSRPVTAAEQTQYGTMGGISKLINPNYYSNEAYINDLIARRVAAKASQVAVYRSPIKTAKGRDPDSNWERARRDIQNQKLVPFEMHHDQPGGSAGLLMGDNYNSRLSNPFVKSLHNVFGRHSGDQEKGFFKYGGAIVEISRLTPSILKDERSINSHVEKESSKIANALTSARMQDGGFVSPPKRNLPIPNTFASYDDPSGAMMIAYQPIVVKQQIQPSSSSNGPVAFPVPVIVGVNNMEQVFNSSRGY